MPLFTFGQAPACTNGGVTYRFGDSICFFNNFYSSGFSGFGVSKYVLDVEFFAMQKLLQIAQIYVEMKSKHKHKRNFCNKVLAVSSWHLRRVHCPLTQTTIHILLWRSFVARVEKAFMHCQSYSAAGRGRGNPPIAWRPLCL